MAAINNLYARAGNISCNKCKQSCNQVRPNYFPTAVNERARDPFWLNWLEYRSAIGRQTQINTYQGIWYLGGQFVLSYFRVFVTS